MYCDDELLSLRKITVKPVYRKTGFGMEVPCLHDFRGDSLSINWVHMKIEGKNPSMRHVKKTGDKRGD